MNYHESCYSIPFIGQTDITVIRSFEKDGRFFSVISDTPFYPEGGGQPCDLGLASDIRVIDVQEKNGEIVLETVRLLVEGTCNAVIDLDRRFDHAEQHTGQHLLSSVILRLFGGATESFHMGEEYSTVDIALDSLDDEDIAAAETECFRIIRDDYPVMIHLCTREEALKLPLRKAPVEAALIRVVEIDGLDFSPCCGTHLLSTGKILSLKILMAEKYKGKIRLSFAAGRRAFLDHQKKAAIVLKARNALSCAEGELGERAFATAEGLKAAKNTVKILSEERAVSEATAAVKNSEGGMVRRLFSDRSADEVFAFVKSCAAMGASCVAVSVPDLKIGASFSSGETADSFKAACLAGGGKGGGNRSFFQAKFTDGESLAKFFETLG